MTNTEWNEGIEYLQNADMGMYIENGNRLVVVENWSEGRYTCYEDREFVRLVQTEAEAMAFLSNAERTKNKAQIGDIIKCKGRRAVIEEIYYQDYYDDFWTIEGTDQDGRYFMWKQAFDGGVLVQI